MVFWGDTFHESQSTPRKTISRADCREKARDRAEEVNVGDIGRVRLGRDVVDEGLQRRAGVDGDGEHLGDDGDDGGPVDAPDLGLVGHCDCTHTTMI